MAVTVEETAVRATDLVAAMVEEMVRATDSEAVTAEETVVVIRVVSLIVTVISAVRMMTKEM